MAKSLHELALDLKDFIVDKHANYRGLKHMSLQRYNNLSLNMNSKRFGKQHVIIKVGMSEVVFSIPDLNKINGGLGMDERWAIMWLQNESVIMELDSHWKTIKLQELSADNKPDIAVVRTE